MPPKRIASTAPGKALSARDQTWRHYSAILESFRKLCHGDAELFRQAEAKVLAKVVTQQWEEQGRPFLDVSSLSSRMAEATIALGDAEAVNSLYRRKLAFRDRLAAVLGKGDAEGWDPFYERCSTNQKAPNTVRQFELVGQVPTPSPKPPEQP